MKSIQVSSVAILVSALWLGMGAAKAQTNSVPTKPMGFFITSVGNGNGANFGGLAGADAHCQKMAAAAGAGSRTWRAYLSTSAAAGKPAVNARDRIGKGPWYSAGGVLIAQNVADLHNDANNINKMMALNEQGTTVKARGETPNMHDILTGSKADGTAHPAEANMTCQNWTVGGPGNVPGQAQIGHHDKQGNTPAGVSWNAAHATRGCGLEDLKASGGAGLLYCFAAD